WLEINIGEWRLPELCECERTEQRTRTAREPLVHSDNWSVVLLYLFFAQRQAGNERNVKFRLNAHRFGLSRSPSMPCFELRTALSRLSTYERRNSRSTCAADLFRLDRPLGICR